jgi:hypothetical protein
MFPTNVVEKNDFMLSFPAILTVLKIPDLENANASELLSRVYIS